MKKILVLFIITLINISIYSNDGDLFFNNETEDTLLFGNLFLNNPLNPFIPSIDNSITIPDFTIHMMEPLDDVKYALIELEPNSDIDYTVIIIDPTNTNDIAQIIEID